MKVIFMMIRCKDKGSLRILMALNIKDSLKVISVMGMESLPRKLEKFMRASGSMVNLMAKDVSLIQMAPSTRATSSTDRKTDMESTATAIKRSTQATGKTINLTEKVNSLSKTVPSTAAK